jgi:hypothetical protein
MNKLNYHNTIIKSTQPMGEGKYWILPVFAYTCHTGYNMIQEEIAKKHKN